MNQAKRKPLLNRNETQTLLTTLKVVSTAGALSLTLAGWGILAQLDATTAQAAVSQKTTLVAALPTASSKVSNNIKILPIPTPTARPTARPTIKLDVVQWVQDVQGDQVAVVRDRRGNLWYVLGSDVPRIEQGQSPLVQPQPVQVTTRSRAS
jgi:hypothetical protein